MSDTESDTSSKATMAVPPAKVPKLTHKGVNYIYVKNKRRRFRGGGAGDDASSHKGKGATSRKRPTKSGHFGSNSAVNDERSRKRLKKSGHKIRNIATNDASSSRKGQTEAVHRSVPQGSEDLGQMRERESPLPDQRTLNKRKRNQNYFMQRAGAPSDNHENDDEDEVVAVDEAEFKRMICSMPTRENGSSEEMEVTETNEIVSRNKTETSSKRDVNAIALSRKNVGRKTQNMYLANQEYDCRSDRGPLNLSGSFLQKGSSSAHQISWVAGNGAPFNQDNWAISSDGGHIDSGVGETDDSSSDSGKGNVKDVEGYIIEEDEPRNKHTDASQCEYLPMSIRTQSRTADKKRSPKTDNVLINISSSSSECGSQYAGDDGVEVTSSRSSDGVVSLSSYHEDNEVQKTYFSSEETGDYSKRDENSVEHIQELSNEAEATEQKGSLGKSRCIRASNRVLSEEEAEEHTEAVDNAVLEQPDSLYKEVTVHHGKSKRSKALRKESKTKAGETSKAPAEKNRTAAANDATGEKGCSRVEGVDRSPSCKKRLIGEVHPVLSGKSGRSRASRKEKKKKAGENNKVPAEKNRTAAANDATGEKGSSRVERVDRSPSCTKRIEAVHPLSEDSDFNCNEDNDVQREVGSTTRLDIDGNGNSERTLVVQTRKKPTSAPEMRTFLVNAIFGTGPPMEDVECNNEDNQAEAPTTDTQNTVPSKFRFEDGGRPEVVEKTEEEKENERLFDEMNLAWQMVMPQASETLNVDPEPERSVAEETQEHRCARGEHEYTTKDDEGQGKNSRRRPSKRPPYLADLLKFEEEPRKFEEVRLKSLVKRDASFNISDQGTVWDIKPGVRQLMYEHQQEGFEFMWRNLAGSINLSELKSSQPRQEGGCIISHAPGTGKTRLTIIFLETYLKMFPRCQPIIIAPAGMLLTWQEEFEKWNFPFPFYNLKPLTFSGKESPFVLKEVTGRMRTMVTVRYGKAYSWDDNVSVLGISYHLFEQLTNDDKKNAKEGKPPKMFDTFLKKILLEKPGLAILDEGHYPRNNSTKIWNSFLELKAQKRVVLSGTPFQNNLVELSNTLRLVRPVVAKMLGDEKTLAGISMSNGKKNNCDDLEKLKSAISPFVSVHKGTILRESLPGLKEVVIVVKPSSLQKPLIEKLKGLNSIEHEHTTALISVHPYLLRQCKAADIERLKVNPSSVKDSMLNPNEGAKTKFIFELLRLAEAAKEKVLIFSQFIHPLNLLKEQLKDRFNWVLDREILLMDGGITLPNRQSMINRYNDPHSEAKVLLASTKCCKEGISLVGASRVVLLDVVWNPSVARQAVARAYRIGQKKFVYAYHLLTSGTNEGHKYSCQTEKSRLSDLVFSSTTDEPDEMKSRAVDVEDHILDNMVEKLNSADTFLKVLNQPTVAELVDIRQ